MTPLRLRGRRRGRSRPARAGSCCPPALVAAREAEPRGRRRRRARPRRDLGSRRLADAPRGSGRECRACCRTPCSKARLITSPFSRPRSATCSRSGRARPSSTPRSARVAMRRFSRPTFAAAAGSSRSTATRTHVRTSIGSLPRAGVQTRFLRGAFDIVLGAARLERGPGRCDPARPRRLEHADRPARARVLLRGGCPARHADGSFGRRVRPRSRQRARRA